jgi:hypothetical protein
MQLVFEMPEDIHGIVKSWMAHSVNG